MSRRRRRGRSKITKGSLIFLAVLMLYSFLHKNMDKFTASENYQAAEQSENQEFVIQAIEDAPVHENNYRTADTTWIVVILISAGCLAVVGTDVLLVYGVLYFKGKRFKSLKNSIKSYIHDCNDLNEHIEVLRSSYYAIRKVDYGEANYEDTSKYKYKRKHNKGLKYEPNIIDCSRVVCDNARKQPFKYICKYFNVEPDRKTLEQFEDILNNFLAAEEGIILISKKKSEIMKMISREIPWVVKKWFAAKLERELGFKEINLNELYFPTFSFRYVSAGGNASTKCDIVMDINMLERFIEYIASFVKFRETTEGQRRLMTPKLRQYIIERDDYTCQLCGNSTDNEPNLLLEVDHIIPIAKGGKTTESNLQTLCWKCNRHKGARLAE